MPTGGKSFQDREKAAKVRMTVLDCIEKVLNEEKEVENWSAYKKDLIRRMATSILPRINEHSGPDGEQLFPAPLLAGESNNKTDVKNSHSNKETSEVEEED